jgi:hypothetical protein
VFILYNSGGEMTDMEVLTQEEIQQHDARGERQRELDRKAGLPDWRELEGKVKAAIEGAHTQCTCDACMTLEAREVVVQVIMPLLREHNKQLRDVIEGLLTEWDKLTRYGSPMAKAANERVAAARKMLEGTSRGKHDFFDEIMKHDDLRMTSRLACLDALEAQCKSTEVNTVAVLAAIGAEREAITEARRSIRRVMDDPTSRS